MYKMLNLNRDTREFDKKILHCFRFFDGIKVTLLLYKLKSNISSGSFYLGFKSSLMSLAKHLVFEFDLLPLLFSALSLCCPCPCTQQILFITICKGSKVQCSTRKLIIINIHCQA